MISWFRIIYLLRKILRKIISFSARLYKNIKINYTRIFCEKIKIDLIPLNGLTAGKDKNNWIITNNDPYFITNACIPKGNITFRLETIVSTCGFLQLFFDYGEGFSEENSIKYYFKREGWHNVKIEFSLNQDVKNVRLDPIDSIGQLYINNVYFERRNSIKGLKKITNYFRNQLETEFIYKIKNCLHEYSIKENHSKQYVDVIVPIYNSFNEVKECVTSILNSPCLTPYRLILIDDCSPDDRISSYLEELKNANIENLIILRNEKNLGFTGTVNKGMALSDNDVVLLNSDTEVTPGWIDRMIEILHLNKTIGTITPFSNNATICSFPVFCQDNALPSNISFLELDEMFKKNAPKVLIDLPTAVGFCMYITRRCLNSVGMFDEITFGKGYGEENDFCMRAYKKGFRNVLCPTLFVYHKGSCSFGEQTRLKQENLEKLSKKHPTYLPKVAAFIAEDPIKPIRNKVYSALNLYQRNKTKGMLYVLHDLGGGTEKHVDELSRSLKDDLRCYILHIGKKNLKLIDQAGESEIFYDFCIDANTNLQRILENIINQFKIDLIHIHQLFYDSLTWMNLFRKINKPYYFTVHDFRAVCPSFNLLNHNMEFCNFQTDINKCQHCLNKSLKKIDIKLWREEWELFLLNAQAVFAPSKSTQEIINKYYASLKITVIEHGVGLFEITSDCIKTNIPLKPADKFRIGLIGAIGYQKGGKLLNELIAESNKQNFPFEWVVIGITDKISENYYAKDKNFIVHGNYKPNEVPALLKAYQIDLVLFISICPETYSYTLSEVILSGYPVVVSNLGALGQRVRDQNCGIVLDSLEVEYILTTLKSTLLDINLMENLRNCINQIKIPSLVDNKKQYMHYYSLS